MFLREYSIITTTPARNGNRRFVARLGRQSGKTTERVLVAIAVVAVAAVLWFKGQGNAPEAPPANSIDYTDILPKNLNQARTEPVRVKDNSSQLGEEKLRGVFDQLKQLNPGFVPAAAGEKHRIEGDEITELSFSSAGVTNLSPVVELHSLRSLSLDGPATKSPLTSLSPLRVLSLNRLSVKNTSVADLSPLRGMPLEFLDITGTAVTDLTPLASLPLSTLRMDMAMVQTKKDVQVLLEEIRTLRTINDMPVPLFLQQAATAPTNSTRMLKPMIDQFVVAVTAMPVERQLLAIMAKLKELNPSFDGREQHQIENGQITEFYISTIGVKDISPLRALKTLKKLSLSHWNGNVNARGGVTSLSPLRGLPLTWLYCHSTDVTELSPLRGMPLTVLSCGNTLVSDLSSLQGMPLTVLSVENTPVTDLAPLAGMPLTVLWCNKTKVSDLSPLSGMPLKELRCDFDKERDYDVLSNIRSLTKINDATAAMFWMSAGARPSGKVKRSH